MCGIVGYYSNNEKVSSKQFSKALSLIKHRGLNDEGYASINNNEFSYYKGEDTNSYFNDYPEIKELEESNFIFGHRRLSILDLTHHGHQPMSYNDLLITYNGEIFNYIEIREELKKLGYEFETNSDTEVFLKAYDYWKEDAFNKFNGMWAAAIYDKKENSIILTRDRFGIKPLYYYMLNGKLVFASEIKSILCLIKKAKVDKTSVLDFIKYMLLDHTEHTFFKDIYQLEPAYYIKIKDNILEKKKYWSLSDIEIKSNYEKSKHETLDLIKDSIRLRLRSDVEVGALLSGGIDSSSIVSVIKHENLQNELKSFSAVFDDEKLSEHKFVKINEDFLNMKANYINPSIEEFESDLKDFIFTNEFPVKSFAVYAQYKIYKSIGTQTNLNVLLNGQGADEIFSGYNAHKFFYLASLLESFSLKTYWNEIKILDFQYDIAKKSAIINSLKILVRAYLGKFIKSKNMYENIFLNNEDKYNQLFYNRRFKNIFKDRLFYDLTISSLREYLRYDDRNSMRFSLESRVPFLDYRLVELIFSLPNRYKFNRGVTKNILRDSMKGIASPEILYRKDKMGFTTPQESWQRTIMKPLFDKTFEKIKNEGLFDFLDSNKIYEIYLKYTHNEINDHGFIWRIFYLYHWKKTWSDYLE